MDIKPKRIRYSVGILIGRFQVDELTDGHKYMIQSIIDNHSKVVVFLGIAPTVSTIRNPLDFESRKQMILNLFPKCHGPICQRPKVR